MDRDAFQKHLRQVFLIELDEHLHALERDLLALEAAGGHGQQSLIESLFRSAHTLKGAAHAVQHSPLEKVAHALESLFVRGRTDSLSVDPTRLQVLFATLDAIREAAVTERAGAGGMDDPAGPLARLIPTLETLSIRETDLPAITASLPDGGAPKMESSVPKQTAAISGDTTPIPQAPPAQDVRETSPSSPADNRQEKTVRLPAARVERLLTLGGELHLTRQRLAAHQQALQRYLNDAGRDVSLAGAERGGERGGGTAQVSQLPQLQKLRELLAALTSDRRALDQVAEPLEADILQVGMAPFAEACEGLVRVVRDLAHNTGKEAQLVIEGSDIEIDRAIIESIRDSLLHLVRNAMAHGIEAPDQRQKLGKPAQGTITVSATLRWGGVEIAVADDGRGLDLGAIRASLDDSGVGVADDRLVQRIFSPGFSTEREVSLLAGRGVGLDVVSTTVNRLRGTVAVDNQPGLGLCFALQLPLTLSVLPAVLVASNEQTYAFDIQAVERLLRISPTDLTSAQGHQALVIDGEAVRVFQLSRVLHGGSVPPVRDDVKVPALLLHSGGVRALFMVDELLEELALPVKSLGPRFRQLRQLVGATLLENGQVTLLLHAPTLIRRALDLTPQGQEATVQNRASQQRKRLLVAEDSLSTRTLMKGILEEEQFTVLVAEDGLQAWQILQREAVDLLVSDVEMPNMDGFSLTEAVRNSSRFKTLPVILVTALKTDQDRLRGMQAGADAYLVKSSFDQSELLAAIHQLL